MLDDEQKRQIHLESRKILQLPSDWSGKFQLANTSDSLYSYVVTGGLEGGIEGNLPRTMLQGVGCSSLKVVVIAHLERQLQTFCVKKVYHWSGFVNIATWHCPISTGRAVGDKDGMNVKSRENMIDVCSVMQPPIVGMGFGHEGHNGRFGEGVEELNQRQF